jgi:hypothetical protein
LSKPVYAETQNNESTGYGSSADPVLSKRHFAVFARQLQVLSQLFRLCLWGGKKIRNMPGIFPGLEADPALSSLSSGRLRPGTLIKSRETCLAGFPVRIFKSPFEYPQGVTWKSGHY